MTRRVLSWRDPVRIRRRKDGTFEVSMIEHLEAQLRSLLGEISVMLDEEPDHPSLRRLSPPAYLDDPERQAAFELLAGEELRTSRRAAIERTLAGLSAGQATEDELWGWMQSINAVRLILGTMLDVTEDMEPLEIDEDDPRFPVFVAYDQMTYVQYRIGEALDPG